MDTDLLNFVIAIAIGTAISETIDGFVDGCIDRYIDGYIDEYVDEYISEYIINGHENQHRELDFRHTTMMDHICNIKKIIKQNRLYHGVTVVIEINKNITNITNIINNINPFISEIQQLNKIIYESDKIIDHCECTVELTKAHDLDTLIDVINNNCYDYTINLKSITYNIGENNDDIIINLNINNNHSMTINRDSSIYTNLVQYGYESNLANYRYENEFRIFHERCNYSSLI
jgi:hypothetical protein